MSNKGTTRTVVLSTVVGAALLAVVIVAVLVIKDATSSDTGAAPSTTVVEVPSSGSPTSTTATRSTTSTPESTRTRPTGAPGTVTYQLTGDGDVVGVAYRTGERMQVVPVTGSPWQQKTTVANRRAELTGVVVRGRITCLILQGEDLLASSTSGVGPFACRAQLPR